MVITPQELMVQGREMLQQKNHWLFVCCEEEAATRLAKLFLLASAFPGLNEEDVVIGCAGFHMRSGRVGTVRAMFIKKASLPIGLLKNAMTHSGVAGNLPNDEQDIIICGFTDETNKINAEFADRLLKGTLEFLPDVRLN